MRTSFRSFALLVFLIGVTLATIACTNGPSDLAKLHRAFPPSNTIDEVVWESGNWEPHLKAGEPGTSWGNHRAVVLVPADSGGETVRATIPWRRHDPEPWEKGLVVVDAATGEPVANALAISVTNESGDIAFQPNPGSREYHVYYLPWTSTGRQYPTLTYPDISPTPDSAWAASVRDAELSLAQTTLIQSVDDFHSFFPMEIIATDEETTAFMEGAPSGWAVVPEHRDFPVRMRRYIPVHWTHQGRADTFRSQVLRDESFTFQLALVSGQDPLSDVQVAFESFPEAWQEALTCFNRGGIDLNGHPFEKRVDVPAGTVQPLWIGVRIPADQPAGSVEGTVVLSSATRGSQRVSVLLDVLDDVAPEAGTAEPDLMTRLAWLNSTAGSESDLIIPPFEPVQVDGHDLAILGRRIKLAKNGLPDQILSYFTPELTDFAETPEPVLARPISLEVTVAGAAENFVTQDFQVTQDSDAKADWQAESTSGRFRMSVDGSLEYDGMLDYKITLVALDDVRVDDITIPIYYAPDAADYMLGLGRPGSRRPDAVDWKWAVENHQEGVWMGAVHKGLQYVLRDDNYARPLNTNFYRNQPLLMPPSWFNSGNGGIRILETPEAVVANNYSGPRALS
ncbi:MAG: hypothetical protein GY906_03685, partial [bacterium]|nr:hypothetical protein [bacterium]